ncbi:MAG: SRPBCC domain-containing protein [Saprospiraceae bacterium]|nr:SRPBCC domain-containing protein [Saprospiraceae bacterium]
MKKSDPPISVSIITQAPKAFIWKALTDLDTMKAWYFSNIDQFKAEVGSKSSFLVENEGRQFTHTWEVIEVTQEASITYTWNYPEYPGFAEVSFNITVIDEHTNKVTVSLVVLEDYPQDIPEFKRESCIGGWEYFMGRLNSFLNAQTT